MILRKEVKTSYFLVSESDPAFLVAGIGFNHNREHICSSILLWGLSAIFALCAIAIPRTSENLEQIIVAIATLVWAVLFIKFFQSKDA